MSIDMLDISDEDCSELVSFYDDLKQRRIDVHKRSLDLAARRREIRKRWLIERNYFDPVTRSRAN